VPSVSELVHGIRLPRLVFRTKVDRTRLEEDIGDTIEDALSAIKSKYDEKPLEKKAFHAALNMHFTVNPELAKQNNLLKGIFILPHAVAKDMKVLIFAKVPSY
jgi:ribosomal protein L1